MGKKTTGKKRSYRIQFSLKLEEQIEICKYLNCSYDDISLACKKIVEKQLLYIKIANMKPKKQSNEERSQTWETMKKEEITPELTAIAQTRWTNE